MFQVLVYCGGGSHYATLRGASVREVMDDLHGHIRAAGKDARNHPLQWVTSKDVTEALAAASGLRPGTVGSSAYLRPAGAGYTEGFRVARLAGHTLVARAT